MAWPCEKTHRCAGSLEEAMGIRKNASRSRWCAADGIHEGWSLWVIDYDFDYDVYINSCLATITYCPFCGKKLEEE